MQKEELVRKVSEIWEKEKILQLKDFVKYLNCSPTTARRYLKRNSAITSYNKKGSYYTLSSIVKFDRNGLWSYKNVKFSKYGNLIESISSIVGLSDAGLYADDIFKLLEFESYSILSRTTKITGLHRDKMFGKFIYFSADNKKKISQIMNREERKKLETSKIISKTSSIVILVEYIKNSELNQKELVFLLKKKNIDISENILYDFLDYHGILKKKILFKP